jgi:SAM-dependent methyltransferase
MNRLYTDLARDWYRLVTPLAEYRDEAADYRAMLAAAGVRPGAAVLELGAGAGHVAHFLKAELVPTLTDLSPDMLALSRAINPECEHVLGDMRTLRLGRRFDAVFLHDAVMYLTTAEDLRAALETAAAHLGPGGVALVVPDCTRETFRPAALTGGHDADGRSLRYLEWQHDPDPADTTALSDFVFVTRDRDGALAVAHDRHVWGLFAEAEWRAAFAAAGYVAERLTTAEGGPAFLGRRTGA